MPAIEAVILDWAGTVVDFGSFAPTTIFVEAFREQYNFEITLDEARGPMGLGKWDHIRELGNDPAVSKRWRAQFGAAMTNENVDALYQTFLPLQIAKVADHSDLIPGALETIRFLRDKNIRIGSCSGYPRAVMDVLVVAAAQKGYRPDCVVASDDLKAGSRPGPWMALQNVIELGINSVRHCIKVDDSAPGIHEGHNAGMWTVGLALSGNESGLTAEQFSRASSDDLTKIRKQASRSLEHAGAHFIIDTIADLPPVIAEIERRLASGFRP